MRRFSGRRCALAALTVTVGVGVAPGLARGQAMPFHTPTAMPLALSEQALRSFYQRVEVGTLLRDGRKVPNPEGLRVSVHAVPAVVPYGVTAKTTLFVGVPYLRKTFESGAGNRSQGGLGDAFVMVKHELLQRDFPVGNRRLAVFGVASVPTGATNAQGEPLPAPLKLGLGTVDLTAFAVYSHVANRLGVHGRLGYAAAIGEDDSFQAGDRWLYDVALGFRLAPSSYQSMRDLTTSAYVELNGTVADRARLDGAGLADSGGHTLFVAPGLQVIPGPNWALEGSLQIPLVREVNGTQLAPDWTLAIGGRVLFFLFGH